MTQTRGHGCPPPLVPRTGQWKNWEPEKRLYCAWEEEDASEASICSAPYPSYPQRPVQPNSTQVLVGPGRPILMRTRARDRSRDIYRMLSTWQALSEESDMCYSQVSWSSRRPYEVGTRIMSIVQMRKLRYGETLSLVPCHTAGNSSLIHP